MFGTSDPQLQRAQELATPPPKGQPYGIPLPGSATNERSAVYRHWKFTDKPLLETLVPEVCTSSRIPGHGANTILSQITTADAAFEAAGT